MQNKKTQVQQGEISRACLTRFGRMTLPYRRYYREGADRRTAFFLTGGPGVSNLTFRPPQAWLDLVDVIVLEYRGVGKSRPSLHSPYFKQALRQPISGLSLAGSSQLAARLDQGFEDLKEQGIVFEDFGLQALASDIEALRQELGLGKIFLIAHSFGTRIAQIMQTLYRSSVQGSLLLGSNWGDGLIWRPSETQQVLRRWLLSDQAKENQLGQSVEQSLLSGWDRGGKWSSNDSKALFMAFFMSFGRSSRKWLFQTLLAAHQGFSLSWYLLGKSFFFAAYVFNWTDFFLKGYLIDGDKEAVASCDHQGQTALFQSPSALLFSGLEGFFRAGGVREKALELDCRNSLLVTGEFDLSTPIERWPEQIPDHYEIILPGQGHTDSLALAQTDEEKWLKALLEMPEID